MSLFGRVCFSGLISSLSEGYKFFYYNGEKKGEIKQWKDHKEKQIWSEQIKSKYIAIAWVNTESTQCQLKNTLYCIFWKIIEETLLILSRCFRNSDPVWTLEHTIWIWVWDQRKKSL